MKIYIKSEERASSVGVSKTKPSECNIYLFNTNGKIYFLLSDKYGNVISRIECSFYILNVVFKDYVYKNIMLGTIFPENQCSLIDNCCIQF